MRITTINNQKSYVLSPCCMSRGVLSSSIPHSEVDTYCHQPSSIDRKLRLNNLQNLS